MRLATLRTDAGTAAVRVDDDHAIEVGAPDVGALLTDPSWRDRAAAADGPRHALDGIARGRWAPVVPQPRKIVCVGLNYANHICEMGRELPAHPTLFAKYPEALVGAFDDIALPAHAASAVDWEGELAIVLGSPARRLDRDAAAGAIAGYSVLNDVTMRDFQYRTPEWFQGKTFEATAPFGPYLVTADAWQPGGELVTLVDGDVVQASPTDDLVFDPADLVAYISQIITLHPGDVIASGTPGGVGHARTPARYLQPGSVLETRIDGLGAQRNRVVAEA